MVTERLVGTRPLLRDAGELHAVWSDPRVAPWLGGERPLAWVRALLVRDIARWKLDGFGAWILRDLATGAVVGRAGLGRAGDEVAIDWVITPERWGEGLATEIARVALGWGFSDLGLESVIAETLTGNVASRRVMEHCGMSYEADTSRAGLPHVRYRLSATNASS